MECHLILSNGVPCVHDEAICQFFGHMFIPELIWKKTFPWLGMALLTSVLVLTISIQLQIPLYTLFPLPTISSEKKGPELMVFFFFS